MFLIDKYIYIYIYIYAGTCSILKKKVKNKAHVDMKYLFLFNGQPLLLCCVCCKIAIQDFLTGLHKKK